LFGRSGRLKRSGKPVKTFFVGEELFDLCDKIGVSCEKLILVRFLPGFNRLKILSEDFVELLLSAGLVGGWLHRSFTPVLADSKRGHSTFYAVLPGRSHEARSKKVG
jgi:hypothetical protein